MESSTGLNVAFQTMETCEFISHSSYIINSSFDSIIVESSTARYIQHGSLGLSCFEAENLNPSLFPYNILMTHLNVNSFLENLAR